MPPRSFRRFVVFFVSLALFVVLQPRAAHAQGLVILQKESLPRVEGGQLVAKRPSGLMPEGVSYQDCVDDQRIRFALQLGTPQPGASLQVWAGLAGASCQDQQARSGSNATCWQLVTGLPLEISPVVDIPVRAIMAGAPPFRPAEPGAPEEVCGKIDLATISVQVLYFSPGQLATPSASDSAAVEVDTVGPAPPSGIRTMPGNGRILVAWNNISGEGGVSLLTGVRAYCDVAQAAGAASASTGEPDAACEEVPNGDAEDGGEDAGTTTVCPDAGSEAAPATSAGGECSSPNLAPQGGEAIVPDAKFNSKYQCGSIAGSTGSSVVATGVGGKALINGTRYAVAVAATDNFDNVGPLSPVTCEIPEPTNDFWEKYKDSGGGAGGGLCTATHAGAPAGSASTLILVGVAAASVLKRRKARR